MFSKTGLRDQMLNSRESLSEEEVSVSSKAVVDKVLNLPDYISADTILAYYPIRNEINTLPIIEDALNKGKRVGLPVTLDNGEMLFYEIWDVSEVSEGRYGVMEPAKDILVEADDAFMIVPGVAFDMRKNRIGFGAGYYDKYLARFSDIYTCALAYDFQVIDAFATEEHDKSVDMIITERQMII
ncbi:MAG: 5-formyltetrahydrofolate cyclo-ligase [Lachnospiraceae bacterium]|nr:5-formyltetrahydrofolate cyclo-ligase [Lachnospiraceae bacterium]